MCRVGGHSSEETAPVSSRCPVLPLGLWVQQHLSLLHCHSFICIHTLMHIRETKEITNNNKEIFCLLIFTAFCHVIILVLAVLQDRQWRGRCLSSVLKDVKLQGQQSCSVSLKLLTIHQECLYWRYVPLDTAVTLLQYMIHVEHRDLRHKILGRVLH